MSASAHTPAQLAFARVHAACQQFVASYKTDERPAAIVESELADADFMATMIGEQVWVRTGGEDGLVLGTVSDAFDRGDLRTQHGVNNWGDFCPASHTVEQAEAFFAGIDAERAFCSAIDAAEREAERLAGTQMSLEFA